MKNSLNFLLFSYGLIYPSKANPLTSSKKALYYIGSGNNRNLLISMFKKRWWWAETDNMNEANLVWTQIRKDAILKET